MLTNGYILTAYRAYSFADRAADTYLFFYTAVKFGNKIGPETFKKESDSTEETEEPDPETTVETSDETSDEVEVEEADVEEEKKGES